MSIFYLPSCHYFLNPSSWAQASQRRRKRCACPPRWPLRWVSLHHAHYGCPPWSSEADAALDCSLLHAARQHNTSGCGAAPHDHRDLLSEAGWQGREGQSKVAVADYGEENTWREGEKDRLERKCEEGERREYRGDSGTLMCDSGGNRPWDYWNQQRLNTPHIWWRSTTCGDCF